MENVAILSLPVINYCCYIFSLLDFDIFYLKMRHFSLPKLLKVGLRIFRKVLDIIYRHYFVVRLRIDTELWSLSKLFIEITVLFFCYF